MKRFFTLASAAFFAVGVSSTAYAQGWAFECIDPENTAPFSTPFSTYTLATDLFSCSFGHLGTVTYGSDTGPCFAPSAITVNNPGGYSFGVGQVGSVQSDFDNLLATSFGWPLVGPREYSYTTIDVNDESFVFGEAGL